MDRAKPGTGVGRYAGRTWCRPSSVRASPCHLPPGEGSGPERLVCTYRPTVSARQVSGRCGHRPLREKGPWPFNGARPDVLQVPSTPVTAAPCHPLQAGEGEPPREDEKPRQAWPDGAFSYQGKLTWKHRRSGRRLRRRNRRPSSRCPRPSHSEWRPRR